MECTLYKNTGFNLVNIPDGPTLLNQNATIKSSVLDCLQNKFLSAISVKIDWTTAQTVDYCNCDGFYYFVTGVTMTSYDVATFNLIPDFITSAGGPNALTILDGVTERHHVAKSDDTFGAYNETDPLVGPAQPEQIEFGAHPFIDPVTIGGSVAIAESSVDLYEMGEQVKNGTTQARTFKDENNEGLEITTPKTVSTKTTTEISMTSESASTDTIGTCMFVSSNQNIKDGIQLCRDIGSEDAVISQYSIQGGMVEYEVSETRPGTLTKITGKTANASTGLPWEYTKVNNKRVLYGDANKYGILTVAGNSYEANPEDIYNSAETSPSILMRVDPRENGKPYFNFDTYRNESNDSNITFFRNAIGGMEWRNVPLRFVQASRNIQDSYNFKTKQSQEYAANQNAIGNYETGQEIAGINMVGGAVSGIGGSVASFLTGDVGEGVTKLLSTGVNATVQGKQYDQAAINETYRRNMYKLARQQELYNFGVSQNVVTPLIKFPFQTPTIRDYLGNGCISYRYRYTPADVTRIDKILTAYGYKHTALLTNEYFTNRTYFNYVKATGVSVGNNLPNWWKSGITNQFSNGIRIWHVKPSPAYYSGGN